MIRKALIAICLVATATVANAFDINAMSDDEKAAFREAVRAYLLDNPEVIFEAVEVYETRQAQAQANADVQLIADNAQEIFNDGRSFVGGNPEGDITIVEFLDYKCGYCKRAFKDVTQLIAGDGNIRFVIKEFPILGEQSSLASRFAISTRLNVGDRAYSAVHDELMVLRGDVSEASLRRISTKLHLNYDDIAAGMNAAEVDAELNANSQLGQKLGISGTPSFVFHSEMLRGYAPLATMQEMVRAIRG